MSKYLKALERELSELPLAVIRNLPGRSGTLARRAYWGRRLASMGKNCGFGCNVHIVNPEYVSLGDDCWIDHNVMIIAGPSQHGPERTKQLAPYNPDVEPGFLRIGSGVHIAPQVVLQAHGGIRIGDAVTIAAGAKVYSLSHHYRNLNDPHDQTPYVFGSMVPRERQFMVEGPVYIGDSSAVGLNAVVLPGTRLEDYAWLGSGSLLSGRTPRGAILSGSPASVIKYRPGFEAAHSRGERSN